jgi:hypothetical protein
MADNRLNRLPVEDARLTNGSLQVCSRGLWHFLGSRVPILAGTDTRIW